MRPHQTLPTHRAKPGFAHWWRPVLYVGLAACTLMLPACGGGGGGDSAANNGTTTPRTQEAILQADAKPANAQEAYRFLSQATFGPTSAEMTRVEALGYEQWIDEQLNMPLSMPTHLQTVQATYQDNASDRPHPVDLVYSWWTRVVRNPAQLRERIAFALSEIFVVSTTSIDHAAEVASYMDMLYNMSDRNYRDVLESVAMHPAMGQYLSHLANRKEDDSIGRVPDENFAREVMQLFSIGLHELDDGGRPRLVDDLPVETYTSTDIQGLARVFTGLSWAHPSTSSSVSWWLCFWGSWECEHANRMTSLMSIYPEEHSTSPKNFLGVSIPAQSTPDAANDLRLALNRLASHPNTAPFICKQLIQRLVTSNPSAAYVADVSAVFRAHQGNLRNVVKAILLHKEARMPASEGLYTYGKLREPLIRAAHLMRAIPHVSDKYSQRLASGALPYYKAWETSDPGYALGQTPMRSPSVFNFFRPGYVPPQTAISDAGLVAPEMQITNETSVLGYAYYLQQMLEQGWGEWSTTLQRFDMRFDLSTWNSLVDTPDALLSAISMRLLGQELPDDVKQEALAGITAMRTGTDKERRQRIQSAILLVALSPSFMIQQ